MKTNNIDLTPYIKGEVKPVKLTKKEFTPEQKKRMAGLFLGIGSCGNLLRDYIDELNELNVSKGYKMTPELEQGYEAIVKFTEEFTNIFSKVIDISSNTNFQEIQNRIDYTIMRAVKMTASNVKK